MLSKKDLAKEFSLVVQQEIKNHNEQLLFSNQSIQDCKRKISELAEKLEKKFASVENSFVYKNSQIIHLESQTEKSIREFERKINDFQKGVDEKITQLLSNIATKETYLLSIDGFKTFETDLQNWQSQIRVAFEKQKATFLDAIKKISDELMSHLDSAKESLDKKIGNHNEKFISIEQTFDLIARNNEGFKLEVERLKKKNFVLEKNIENIYTQIERLKEDR